MKSTEHKSIFSRVGDIFANEKQVKKPVAEMRPLTDHELRAVAGGPELEVGNGV